MKYLELLKYLISSHCFPGSWYSHCICCVIKPDGHFLFLSLLDLSIVFDTVVDMVVQYMPSFLKHSSSPASVPHYSFISLLLWLLSLSILPQPTSFDQIFKCWNSSRPNPGSSFLLTLYCTPLDESMTPIIMNSLKFIAFTQISQLSPNASISQAAITNTIDWVA